MENEITLEHIKQAAQWAQKAASDPLPLDGLVREYDQSDWDCGTSCCMWGAASIIAGNGPAKCGPPPEWAAQGARHMLAAALMNSGDSRPEQMISILDANLTGADLTGVNLRGANLTDANLRGADLTGAYIFLGNVTARIQ